MSHKAAGRSQFYRKKWIPARRPRPTNKFKKTCKYVQVPFTLVDSLPLVTEKAQVNLSSWESALRAIEEDVMISIFGSVPNVIWASIIARVFENAESDFDKHSFLKWNNDKINKNTDEQLKDLGCPWKGTGSRLLPKGACGTSQSKPMHDDNNGVISLGCWTSLTESNVETDLVFVINGFEVSLSASKLRWVLFMGYLPHETRAKESHHNTVHKPRLHHSAFTKPDMEYAATHILSNLSCKDNNGDWIDWSMDFVDSSYGMRECRRRKYNNNELN